MKQTPRVELYASDDPANMYWHEVGKTPRLSSVEEDQIYQQLKNKRDAQETLCLQSDTLSDVRKTELIQRIEEGNHASEWFIQANQRLVMSVASHYLNRGVPYMDLIQEGNLGFMRAIEKYDFRPEAKLTTYAKWWIRQKMIRIIENEGNTIRVPARFINSSRTYAQVSAVFEQAFGRRPNEEEAAELLINKDLQVLQEKNLPIPSEEELPKLLKKKMKLVGLLERTNTIQPIDLDQPISTKNGRSETLIGEQLADVTQVLEVDPDNVDVNTDFHIQLFLGALTPREAYVLIKHYGLYEEVSVTLEKVGEAIGVSEDIAGKIEKNALRKINQFIQDRR